MARDRPRRPPEELGGKARIAEAVETGKSAGGAAMFKGNVYSRAWVHHGKKRKAWGIRYSVDGGPVVRRIVADTKDGADAELDKIREDYRNRMLGVAEGKTLADLAPKYLAFKEQQGRVMQPIRSRVNTLLQFFRKTLVVDIDEERSILPFIQARKAQYRMQPCREHGDAKRCATCDRRVSGPTINRDLAVLRNMLRLARRWKWIRQRPEFDLLPEHAPRDLELSPAEEERFLAVCAPALADLVAGALATGMRQGELLTLTWPQVDLAARTIDFPPTKRGRKRLMPINEALFYVLARRKAAAQAKAATAAPAEPEAGPKPPDRVFCRPDGAPWSKTAVQDHFGKALAAAGIEKPLVFHDLRHTFASRLKRNGVQATEIQRLLGHKTLAMTDRYITVEVEQMRAAVASLASTRRAQEPAPVSAAAGNSAE